MEHTRIFRFATFEFHSRSGELFKGGRRIPLQPQPARLLTLLLSRAPDMVDREEIQAALWEDSNVDYELGINRCVRQLRAALLDDGGSPKYVERIPRRGYRFLATVSPATASAEVSDADSVTGPSIVVLPFANLSGNPDDEYLSDGLTEEITNVLVQADLLKVIARTSAFAFKGKNQDIRTIAATVGATNVLEGSVRRAGTRLRITAQLIRASDGIHLFSKRYDRDTPDIFAIQDEISADVARTLQVHLTAPHHARTNADAYEALLEGRFHWHKYTPAGFRLAYSCFERAATLDPGFSPAYTGMAEYFLGMAVDGGVPPREFLPQGLAAARRALDCDARDADAHAVLAQIVAMLEYDWGEAERHFRTARELMPGPHTGIGYVTWFLLPQGRSEEAVLECDRVIQRDPLLVLGRTTKASALWFARDYNRAAEACEEALSMDPEFVKAWQILTYIRGMQGHFRAGLDCAEKVLSIAGRSHLSLFTMAAAHAAVGDATASHRILGEIEGLPGGSRLAPAGIASVHARLGEADAALRWLQTAIDCRDPRALWMRIHPWADSLRSDPRFAALTGKMNLPSAYCPTTASWVRR